MKLRTFFAQSLDLSDSDYAEDFAVLWKPIRLRKGEYVNRQGHPETEEYIVLEGRLTS